MTTKQITLKTRPGQSITALTEKVNHYADVILITTAFYRNEEGEWSTSITIEAEQCD